MKVHVRRVDDISIIDCSGDVDLYTSTHLRQALLAEMQSGTRNVLVNMSDVAYIDSSGIATLVEGLQRSRQTQTRLGLFGLRGNTRSVLELARLDKVFNLFENEQEAREKILTVKPFSGL
jgi:anti-sigma B factor antagonist